MSEHKVGGGNAETLERYVLATGANEEPPELVEGDIKDIKRNDLRAQLHGHKFGNLHFSLTSDREISRKDIKAYKRNIERSYGISLKDHPHVLVQHKKPRADGTGYEYHFHLVVAYTSRSGKAANIHAAVKKNELVGRLTEFELGHPLQKGKHNLSVRKAAVALGLKDFVAAVDAAKICEGHRAEARYGSKQKEKAKRLGFPLRDFTSAIRAIPEGADRFRQVKEIVSQFGAEIGKSDRRNALSVRVDGKEVVANFNKLLGLRAADTPDLIARLNAAETTAAHTIAIKEETENGRGTPTTGAARTAGAGTATAERNADAGRDPTAHVALTRNGGEAGPSAKPEAGLAGRAGADRGPAKSARGHSERPHGGSKLAALGKLIRAEVAASHNKDEVTSGPVAHRFGPPDTARSGAGSARRGLNYLEVSKLQNALAASGISPKSLLKTETRPIAEAPVARFDMPLPRPALSHLQAAKLQAALAGKPKKTLKKANRMAMAEVPMPAFALTQKAFLTHLQAAKLNAALEAKFGAAIRDAARKPLLKKVETEGYRHAIPSAADLPPLNTKAIRELFAPTKTLSGQAKMDAVAAILQAHGLRLAAGAKPGVIAIERPLGNGTAEFVGSLDRFAGAKSSNADRAAIMAEITSRINVSEAPEANLLSSKKEAKNEVSRKENGNAAWREYAGRLDATAEKAVAGVRAAAATGRDRNDAAGDKKPADLDANSVAGRSDNGSEDARGLRGNDRKDQRHRDAGDRPPRHDGRPSNVGEPDEIRAVGGVAALTAAELKALKEVVAGAVGRHQFAKQAELKVDSWKLLTEKSVVKPTPAVNLAPVGKVRPRVPSAPPARQSAFRRGLAAGGGGAGPSRPFNDGHIMGQADQPLVGDPNKAPGC